MLRNTGPARRIRAHIERYADPIMRLRRALGECGYLIFPVHPNRKTKGGRNQMLIFDKRQPTAPLFIYERPDGKFMVRPFSGADRYTILRDRLAARGGNIPKLILAGNMAYKGKEGYPWASWLTEATKQELREAGVDV